MLKNKNIVIIGGTTGLGLSAAKAFSEKGANLVCVGRNEESVAEAKKQLGNNAIIIPGDAVIPATAAEAINTCIERFGSFIIDGLRHCLRAHGSAHGRGHLRRQPHGRHPAEWSGGAGRGAAHLDE